MKDSGGRAHWQNLLDCLRSPCCGASLETSNGGAVCQTCGAVYPEREGILVLLKDQGQANQDATEGNA